MAFEALRFDRHEESMPQLVPYSMLGFYWTSSGVPGQVGGGTRCGRRRRRSAPPE